MSELPEFLGYGEAAERVRMAGRSMQDAGRQMVKRVRVPLRSALPSFRDLHVYGGGGLVSWGAWMAWEPGGLIVFGALLMYLGLWRS